MQWWLKVHAVNLRQYWFHSGWLVFKTTTTKTTKNKTNRQEKKTELPPVKSWGMLVLMNKCVFKFKYVFFQSFNCLVILFRWFLEVGGASKSWEVEKILGPQGCILSVLCEFNLHLIFKCLLIIILWVIVVLIKSHLPQGQGNQSVTIIAKWECDQTLSVTSCHKMGFHALVLWKFNSFQYQQHTLICFSWNVKLAVILLTLILKGQIIENFCFIYTL